MGKWYNRIIKYIGIFSIIIPFNDGWFEGYNLEYPDCSYEEGTYEYSEWWKGYITGYKERNSKY